MPFEPLSIGQTRRIALESIPNNLITALGDSITDNMGPWPRQTDTSWLAWACYAAGSVLTPYAPYGIQGAKTGPVAGDGGASNILDDALPVILALNPKPAYCVVLAGTNNAGGEVSLDVTAAHLTAIYDALLNHGITPISATIPPRDALGGNFPAIRSMTRKINAWITENAFRRGFPFVDFHGAVVDSASATGSAQSGFLLADGIHPTGIGARAMGLALAPLITTLGFRGAPRLATDNGDTSLTAAETGISLANPLLLTDANSDGIPDQWTSPFGSGHTVSLEDAGDDALGNWLVLTKASGTDFSVVRSAAIPIVTGDRIRFSGKFLMESMNAAAGVLIAVGDYSVTTKPFINAIYFGKLDRPVQTFDLEAFVPGDIGLGANAAVWMGITGGPGIAKLAQPTVRNFTALGLDP